MLRKPVCFVAFEEQDNLGIGYLASVLLQSGFEIKIIDFRLGKKDVLQRLTVYNPLVVGFSIIFQYHIDDFKELINYLRENGVNCHFSAGGHYPSLQYAELLKLIPNLDSIVLFEGEHTFLELVQAISAGKEWTNIKGLAYRIGKSIKTNSLRPLEKDLDNFPPPVRQPSKEYALGKKYATLLAGRGCVYDCSFCSIREFYSKPPGPVKRVRRPEMVAKEMELLFKQKDCSLFMFQDDDFPVAGNSGKKWVTQFCKLLSDNGLSENILWKINCRSDEVDANLFGLMKDCGLFLVYLGIESGTDDGLRLMNKRMNVETNIKAVNTLNQLGIRYDFGFMLFDPSTTHKSIFDNLDFLEKICGDGSSPITFCKLLPYAGTKIERELRKEGRLKEKSGFSDYDFLDHSLNRFYSFMVDCFMDWVMQRDGLLNTSRWARYYLAVYEKYFQPNMDFRELVQAVTETVAQSNRYFIDVAKRLNAIFSAQDYLNRFDELKQIKDDVAATHSANKVKLEETIINIERLSKKANVFPSSLGQKI